MDVPVERPGLAFGGVLDATSALRKAMGPNNRPHAGPMD
jgi:hypothetical protein